LKEALNKKVHLIGNIVHPSCIASKDEDLNEVVQTWGIDKIEEVKIDGHMGWLHHH